MRCTCGHAYLSGMRDRPCNQGLIPLPYHSRLKPPEHDIPGLVCPHCDHVKAWPDPTLKENT